MLTVTNFCVNVITSPVLPQLISVHIWLLTAINWQFYFSSFHALDIKLMDNFQWIQLIIDRSVCISFLLCSRTYNDSHSLLWHYKLMHLNAKRWMIPNFDRINLLDTFSIKIIQAIHKLFSILNPTQDFVWFWAQKRWIPVQSFVAGVIWVFENRQFTGCLETNLSDTIIRISNFSINLKLGTRSSLQKRLHWSRLISIPIVNWIFMFTLKPKMNFNKQIVNA